MKIVICEPGQAARMKAPSVTAQGAATAPPKGAPREAGRSISQQLEDIAAEICDKYCKYMVTAQGEDDLARHCDKCPLNRLVS